MKLTLTAMLFLTLLSLSAISADAAEPAIPAIKTDIEFAKVGDVSLTLDAFVPEGVGPFPTCILVAWRRVYDGKINAICQAINSLGQ